MNRRSFLASAAGFGAVMKQSAGGNRPERWFSQVPTDLGGIAVPLKMPHRQFAVLVAGPMFRVKARSAELAKIMTREIARHLADSSKEA